MSAARRSARINRSSDVPRFVLRSLRAYYAEANQTAADLLRAYQGNPLAIIDLQREIERGANRANKLALRAQTSVEGGQP